MRSTTFISILFALGSARAPAASAQAGRAAVIRVRVSQANGAAIADVDLVVIRDGQQAILVGRTDTAGTFMFRLDVDSSRKYSLAARRLGFMPATSAISPVVGDTLAIDIALERTGPAKLPTVRIQGKTSDHFIGAAEIEDAGRHRAIYDAFDAVRKLRPYMLGDPMRCRGEGPTDNVWVNGRRVMFMAGRVPAPPAVGTRSRARPGMSVIPHIAANKGGVGLAAVGSTLASVKAEHIEEIRWIDCNDHSLPGMGMSNAIFITLKPGVDWAYNRGSFIDSSTVKALSPRKPD